MLFDQGLFEHYIERVSRTGNTDHCNATDFVTSVEVICTVNRCTLTNVKYCPNKVTLASY